MTLRVIVGPTAAGKSDLAMHLARERSLSIISADSRQVYQGFDIGTAKPSAFERALVPHYGIDVVAPTASYSAYAWARGADRWISDASAARRPAVIVGGTGFYVRALVSPLDALPPDETHRREALARWLDTLDGDEIARWCGMLDPARASLGRTQHVRAVETALLSGRRISDAYGMATAPVRAARYLLVDPGDGLAARIRARVSRMVATGWLDEVAALRTTVPEDALAWKASGYLVMRQHADGRLDLDEAMERVTIATRQYAKRQRTWFRHQLREGTVTTIHPEAHDARRRVLAWYDASDDA